MTNLRTTALPMDVQTSLSKDAGGCEPRTIPFRFGIFQELHQLLTPAETAERAALHELFLQKRAGMSPVLRKKALERLAIDFSWKSCRMEGCRYSVLDAEALIREHVTAGARTLEEALMILNQYRALEQILSCPDEYSAPGLAQILSLHSLLVEGLGIAPGLRTGPVGIVGTRYRPPNPLQLQAALAELIQLLDQDHPPPGTGAAGSPAALLHPAFLGRQQAGGTASRQCHPARRRLLPALLLQRRRKRLQKSPAPFLRTEQLYLV